MLLQELFLKSSAPRAALEMRVDLKHWQEALRLAQQMDPEAVPVICKEQAQMMEVVGDYQQARAYYQQVRPSGCADGVERQAAGNSTEADRYLLCGHVHVMRVYCDMVRDECGFQMNTAIERHLGGNTDNTATCNHIVVSWFVIREENAISVAVHLYTKYMMQRVLQKMVK
jgi:hypothetical protein